MTLRRWDIRAFWLIILPLLAGCAPAVAPAVGNASTTPVGTTSPAVNQPAHDLRLGQAEFGVGPGLPVGTMAPDFSLPEAQSVVNNPRDAATSVRLSAFRGKKSVVLIGTAYT